MPVTVDGIVSGIDTTALINAILTAQSVPIATMKSHLADFEKQREAVSGVKNRLTTLSNALKGMNTADTLLTYKATTSSSQYTATATTGAQPGSYAVRVMNLATAQSTASDGWDDKALAQFGTGTLSVTVGGTTTDLTIDGTNNSLTGIAAALNGVDGLSAFVVDTGAATGRYKLMVQGEDTGAANAFTLDTSGLTGSVPAFANLTTAGDAYVQINGLDVYSASNTLSSAIPGVQLDLTAAGSAADALDVTADKDAMKAKLQEMVTAYNDLVDYYGTQTAFNAELDIRGALIGDSTTRRAMEDVGAMFSDQYAVAGVDVSALSQLGLATGRDGKLTLDEDAFDVAFDADPDGTVAFLTSDDGPLTTISTRIDDLYVDADTGSLITREESLDTTIEDQNEAIAAAEERMAAYAEILRKQFTAMEVALSNIQSVQGYINALMPVPTTTSTSAS